MNISIFLANKKNFFKMLSAFSYLFVFIIDTMFKQGFRLDRCNNKEPVFPKSNIDRFAYTELVRNYSARVFAICLSMLSNREDAEDITQQAFLTGFEDIQQLRDADKFDVWITQIAKNMCLDFLRRKKLNKIALKQIAADDIKDESDCDRDKYSRLESALAQLAEEYRLPLMLYYFDGQSTQKIAEALELTVATAQTRLSRARKQLRQLLGTEGGA
jgi:RNA polymerase sigma-70 factor, ECF subfamily